MWSRPPAQPGGWRGVSAKVGEHTVHGAILVQGGQVQVVAGAGERTAPLAAGEDPLGVAGRLLGEIAAELGPEALAEPAVVPIAPPNNLVGLGLLAAFVAFGAGLVLAPGFAPFTFLFVLAGWILAVMAHEFAHAAVAYLGGDHTAAAKGYLAFDPRRYGDVRTSLILPVIALAFGGIGFPGGAVWLRQDLIRGPFWRAAASLAGPGATLALLLLLTTILRETAGAGAGSPLYAAVALLAFLQATALILNLMPFPGLDGFNAIRPFLPRAWMPAIARYEGLVMVGVLLALLFVPGVGSTLFRAAATLTVGLGAPVAALQDGWAAFHFWKA